MSRLDRLILGEMFGPWAFGVAIFTVLIMAGTYLFTITNYIVSGVSFQTIMEYTMLLLPGVMVKTFAMAVLLSTLLSFGRLSSDSEIVAMKAAGASVPRIMIPVAAFGLLVAGLAFVTNETLVSYAAKRGEAIKDEIQRKVSSSSTSVSDLIYDKQHKVKAELMALDLDIGAKSLKGVTITILDSKGNPSAFLYSPKMLYTPESSEEAKWKIGDGSIIVPVDGGPVVHLGPTYPAPQPDNPDELLAKQLKDLDALNMGQMREAINKLQANAAGATGQIANLWYGYYNKIALPLAALIFGLVGAPLGIRSHRTGAATGFWLSVVIIFAYMMLANLMNIYAMGQKIPPYVASFTPLVIGLVFSIVLIYKKNR